MTERDLYIRDDIEIFFRIMVYYETDKKQKQRNYLDDPDQFGSICSEIYVS